ncbi:hypothetical protein CVT25_006271 [Psilocybe cyanescens]|uniref:Uncharacterized protein n=1 Tax=Psilocybe cyanescens TaxID=93625 RepID=A0A409WYR8_PSICY|nr:hypothetical protein CVT25_006271 [Psilocybe cyanescens]
MYAYQSEILNIDKAEHKSATEPGHSEHERHGEHLAGETMVKSVGTEARAGLAQNFKWSAAEVPLPPASHFQRRYVEIL